MEAKPLKRYPILGACGLDCGLCPRFHSGGDKPCPGCCGEGFWEVHPSCPFITCAVKQRGLECCGECNELEFCPRVMRNLEGAKKGGSFISYQTLAANLDAVHQHGLKKVVARLQEKVVFLKLLINEYNDGRSKGFYCLAVQLLPLDGLKQALAQTKLPTGATPKEKALGLREAFGRLASARSVELKLRNGKGG